jgi:2-iminobutanoate/2-iminopropanoate deaminase
MVAHAQTDVHDVGSTPKEIPMPEVETATTANTPTPIGPYNHIAKVGDLVTIGGTAGVDPSTGSLAGGDVASQTSQILDNFRVRHGSSGAASSQA